MDVSSSNRQSARVPCSSPVAPMTTFSRSLVAFPIALTLAAANLVAQPPPAPQSGAPGGRPPIEITAPRPSRTMPPRDGRAAAPETGTGRIRGRITDDAGQPLRRAVVTLFGGQRGQPRTTLTDADGRYEVVDLPAGTFQVMATKGAFVRVSYGQRTPRGPGRPIELGEGQSIDKIDITLPRGGVIAGRVVDELGEALAEATVSAVRPLTTNGRSRLVPMGRSVQTDDLGQFRLYGLPPGEYYVSAVLRSGGMGMPANEAAGDPTGYAPTFAPGTTSLTDATRVQVEAGQDINADIQLTAARLHRVSGTVVTAAGTPPRGGMARLIARGEMVLMNNFMGVPVRDGAFAIGQVPPGTYTLSIQVSESNEFMGPRRGMDEMEFAVMPVTVAGEDLVNLRVVTGRGLSVAGMLVAEGGALPPDAQIRVMIIGSEFDGSMAGRPGLVEPDGRFRIDGISGEGTVQVIGGMPRGWMLRSVTYKGADITDKATEFAADGGPLRVVITNRITVVTGTVSAGAGPPLPDYEVLIFPQDESRWSNAGRRLRVLRPDQQGVFKAEGLPAGDYHVAAFAALDEEQRSSPEFLEKARSLAQSVTLREGQTQSLTLRLSALPQ